MNVRIGIVGVNDAFIGLNKYICFALNRMYQLYGPVDKTSNQDRLERFFRHEYSHLLNKRFVKQKKVPRNTPFQRAIWHAWTEGLGHYYSLSKSWKPVEKQLPEKTRNALASGEEGITSQCHGGTVVGALPPSTTPTEPAVDK